MSLDSRLRADLREIAADIDPSVDAALRSVLARRDRRVSTRSRVPRVLAAAACLALVGGLLTWWFTGRHSDEGVVIEPHPPSGTYEATLDGADTGRWRLRFDKGRMSLVAPDTAVLGARVASATYEVRGGKLTTELLADRCDGPGTYTWQEGRQGSLLLLRVFDDDCSLRVRLLTAQNWSHVAGAPLVAGTYATTPLTVDRMRAVALADGFRAADVDDYLTSVFPGVRTVTYTLGTQDGDWIVYDSEDNGAPTVSWAGHYDVTDAATVVVDGEDECVPITYDYRVTGDTVDFVLVDDPCTAPEEVGELIAQTMIYESAPFERLE